MGGIKAINIISLSTLAVRLSRVEAGLGMSAQANETIGLRNLSDNILRVEVKLGLYTPSSEAISLIDLDGRLKMIEGILMDLENATKKQRQLLDLLAGIMRQMKSIWDWLVKSLTG